MDSEKVYDECGSCSGCEMWVYHGDFKTCLKCRDRSDENKKISRENIIKCKKDDCPFKVSVHGLYTDYCGNHQRYAWKVDIEKDGQEKECTQYIRNCKKIKQPEKCTYCLCFLSF